MANQEMEIPSDVTLRRDTEEPVLPLQISGADDQVASQQVHWPISFRSNVALIPVTQPRTVPRARCFTVIYSGRDPPPQGHVGESHLVQKRVKYSENSRVR